MRPDLSERLYRITKISILGPLTFIILGTAGLLFLKQSPFEQTTFFSTIALAALVLGILMPHLFGVFGLTMLFSDKTLARSFQKPTYALWWVCLLFCSIWFTFFGVLDLLLILNPSLFPQF